MSVKADKNIIMPIFYNEAIYDSAADYEIGGFFTEKKENITYPDIYAAYVNRISDFVDEYLSIAIDSYAIQGYESPQTEALNALALVVEDNLKIQVPYNSKSQIIDAIVTSEQSNKWLLKIQDRIEGYSSNSVMQQFGITSIPNAKTRLNKQAVEIMQDSSLESILERLSTIEL
jgi:hypothetical protein